MSKKRKGNKVKGNTYMKAIKTFAVLCILFIAVGMIVSYFKLSKESIGYWICVGFLSVAFIDYAMASITCIKRYKTQQDN